MQESAAQKYMSDKPYVAHVNMHVKACFCLHADDHAVHSDADADSEAQYRTEDAPVESRAGADVTQAVTRQQSSASEHSIADSVSGELLMSTQQPSSALLQEQQLYKTPATEQQQSASAALAQHQALDKQPETARERTTVDSVLDAVLDQAARQGSDIASQAGSLTPAASASVDSFLDNVLQEAAAAVNAGRTTADHVLDEVLAEAAAHDQQGGHHAVYTVVNSSINDSTTTAASPHRSTAEQLTSHPARRDALQLQQLASQDRQLSQASQQHAVSSDTHPRATVDQVLDTVLDQVATDASRQRTTADSVLDAVLRDVTGTGLQTSSRQASGTLAEADVSKVDEEQEEGYASQVLAAC